QPAQKRASSSLARGTCVRIAPLVYPVGDEHRHRNARRQRPEGQATSRRAVLTVGEVVERRAQQIPRGGEVEQPFLVRAERGGAEAERGGVRDQRRHSVP